MDVEISRIIEVSLYNTSALVYCYLITTKIPKGILRILSLLPIILLFSLIPLRLTFGFSIVIASFFLTWLANFKLILFAFGLGPLCPNPKNPHISFSRFIAFSCLPIQSKSNYSMNLPKSKLKLSLAAELVIIPVLLSFNTANYTRINMVHVGFQLFLLIDIIMAISNVLAKVLFRISELESPSNEPYLATSLQDFWGRRWNLVVTNTLRITIFKPVKLLATRVIGELAATILGILATFIVSGLMHEVFFYHITRVYPTWEYTGFFVLHGICVIIEFGLKKMFVGRLILPTIVSTVLSWGFVVATSFWLFFPSLINSGVDTKIWAEYFVFVGFLKESFLQLN